LWNNNGTQVAGIYTRMYATKLLTQIYHLVQPGGNHTLCGLRVSRVPMGAKLPGNLQLINEVPPDKTICKHCERLNSAGVPSYSKQRPSVDDVSR
jgi:hypothetical protein